MAHDMRRILELALEHGASDAVVTAGAVVGYKINGRWAALSGEPLTAEQSRALVHAVLSPEQAARLEREREIVFSFEVDFGARAAKEGEAPAPAGAVAVAAPDPERRRARFRGSAFFQRGAVGGVFRLISKEVPSIEQLGLPTSLETFALQPQGLVLVAGPGGHGRTTTIAAMIDAVNRNRRCHVISIEDPVEYTHRSRLAVIEQREVGGDTPSCASALRQAARQAPDVIAISEMRDAETFAAALAAADAGQLVLACAPGGDCVKVIDAIIDSFPPHAQGQVRAQLAQALIAVVYQRLIPTQDGKGRVVAVELLVNSATVAGLIREQKIYQIYGVLESAGAKDGMIAMDASITRLYQTGRISLAEAKLRMKNPSSLEIRRADAVAAGTGPGGGKR
jgi:twitching motility protein PilT